MYIDHIKLTAIDATGESAFSLKISMFSCDPVMWYLLSSFSSANLKSDMTNFRNTAEQSE
jgi:hypothetical protein